MCNRIPYGVIVAQKILTFQVWEQSLVGVLTLKANNMIGNSKTDESFKVLSGKVLLALVELYLATFKEDMNEQYIIDFCDKLNQLSVTY